MKRVFVAFGIFISVGLLPILFGASTHAAMPVPPKPDKNGYVRDETSTLTSEQVQKLNEKIQGYRERTNNQLAVLMVPTLTDDYLENFSINVARTWGVGEVGKNNGALLLVVKNDRKMRIEVGSGLEGKLTDLRSSRIIRDRIAPEFRKDNYYQGIVSGLDGISLAIGDAPDPLLAREDTTEKNWLSGIGDAFVWLIYLGFFGVTWLGSILGRSERWWPGGVIGAVTGSGAGFLFAQGTLSVALISGFVLALIGLAFDYFVSKNFRNAKRRGDEPAWWAGGTTIGPGSSGGDSGFGGFGGGGFSGGGSSGDW
jgi:uncharacterized protein